MYHKRSRKYQAVIGFNGDRIHIGEFDSPVAAAKARDRKALELQGEFAYLNFPELRETAKRIVSLAGRSTLCSRAVGTLSRGRTTAA